VCVAHTPPTCYRHTVAAPFVSPFDCRPGAVALLSHTRDAAVPPAVLPGLVIQVAQNRLDQHFDEFGIDRFDTSYGVSICRVVTGHVLQLVALLVFLGGLHDEDNPELHRSSAKTRAWDDDMSFHMYCTFIVIGTGCAIVYGTYSQAVSMFPERYHAFFFIGTYRCVRKQSSSCFSLNFSS
jgi:hypothetical protein